MITITVFPEMIAGTIAANQVISQFSIPALLTGSVPVGGNPPYAYQWEKSTDQVTFSPILGATSLNYQPDPLSVTTYFRQLQISTGDFGVMTNVVTITITIVPQNQNLTNIYISGTQSRCFDAIQTITVAGGGSTFQVQSGGLVNLIAGEKILMSTGTKVESGGYLHGYITNSGTFCGSLKSIIPAVLIEPSESENWFISNNSDQFFGCYPNPTSGLINLWLSEEPTGTVVIRIHSLLGVEVTSKTIISGKFHELSLVYQAKGIYLITVT